MDINEKTPLWFLVAVVAYIIPVTTLLFLFPMFAGMVETYVTHDNVTVPETIMTMWTLAIPLDAFLFAYAYGVAKFDHIIPWLMKLKEKN